MPVSSRLSIPSVCLALAVAAAGCGSAGNPTSPTPAGTGSTSSTGAVVAGVVNGGGQPTEATGATAGVPSGLTVSVMGSARSAPVTPDGSFELENVPPGNVQLQFRSDVVNAMATLSNVTNDQFIRIQVQVNTDSALIVDETREEKISLCHAEGNGTYHLIDVSRSAEATHREHGDGQIGDPVPGQPFRTFDASCRPVGPEVHIEKSTNGADADDAPGARIPVGTPLTWEYVVSNTGTLALSGIAVSDDQGVTVTCPQTTLAVGASMTCKGTGLVTAIGPYRNVGSVTAQFTATTGSGSVNDSDPSHYTGVSPLELEKRTNGEDADEGPGPRIPVGGAVLWEYTLKNIGVVPLTGITVTDDHETVDCGGVTTLAAGASVTCTATGTAVLGSYANLGTATATWTAGTASGTVTATDPSHYVGVSDEEEGPKVSLCHRTGNGSYHLITVSINAEPAHRAHGDAMIGEPVPNLPGHVFTAGCGIS
ncbi:MAG: hypothetical protein R2752_05125 [Vicinamibacterales bacterium]